MSSTFTTKYYREYFWGYKTKPVIHGRDCRSKLFENHVSANVDFRLFIVTESKHIKVALG